MLVKLCYHLSGNVGRLISLGREAVDLAAPAEQEPKEEPELACRGPGRMLLTVEAAADGSQGLRTVSVELGALKAVTKVMHCGMWGVDQNQKQEAEERPKVCP